MRVFFDRTHQIAHLAIQFYRERGSGKSFANRRRKIQTRYGTGKFFYIAVG
jgi:hypothetical protein